ncbi:BMP family ABC transporter substrate-binding protein [Longimicrobium sp.]|uniref:BMP family lipoprotein n=1 Tax=Longimicrobium sp. TaxID=2029185 RepID=UPI002E2ECCB1|nr:BMP family ABC transporter substrate-binding protein [Longimicrobium sp.]HEX6039979.1 BMP family ABC transporter substrate-binding protein [Longimicrobium sp.]
MAADLRRSLRPALAPLLVALPLLAGCGAEGDGGRSEKNDHVSVGLVLGSGGRGDRGFNDAALAGLAAAARDLDADTAVSADASDDVRREELLAQVRAGRDLVIGVSFMASEPAFALAREHPEVDFAVLDYTAVSDAQGRAMAPPANLAGITYRSEEGAFLAGALAGLMTRTGQVGFVGGMDSPPIRQFQAGYAAGVLRVCPACRVAVDYAGATGAAFNDPARGYALASVQYAGGVDVIFHASGGTGIGVFRAARETGRWVIGVDVDQWDQAPGRVLTSITKRLDVSVLGVVRDEAAGRFRGGVLSQGLAEEAVGWIVDARNRPLIPDEVYNRVETLRQAIIAGLIQVPRVPERATD